MRIRKTDHEARIEMMPLIDVIFLLLTFFIYAMVLMIRAEILPIEMAELASGETAEPEPAVTISIDGKGAVYVDREPTAIDAVADRIRAAQAREPRTIVYLAAAIDGELDRLPTFLELYDRLALAGLDIRLVGRPKDDAAGSPGP